MLPSPRSRGPRPAARPRPSSPVPVSHHVGRWSRPAPPSRWTSSRHRTCVEVTSRSVSVGRPPSPGRRDRLVRVAAPRAGRTGAGMHAHVAGPGRARCGLRRRRDWCRGKDASRWRARCRRMYSMLLPHRCHRLLRGPLDHHVGTPSCARCRPGIVSRPSTWLTTGSALAGATRYRGSVLEREGGRDAADLVEDFLRAAVRLRGVRRLAPGQTTGVPRGPPVS